MPRCFDSDYFPSRVIVNEAPDGPSPEIIAPAATPSWSLWAVCLAVMAAVLVAWSADRAKPLVIFPLLLGAALGGAAVLFARYCDLPRRRSAVVAVIIGAGGLVLASCFVSAKRQQTPTNPLAERLIQHIEKQDPVSIEPTSSAIEAYLHHRYGNGERLRMILCLLGEAAASSVGAAVIMRFFWPSKTDQATSSGTR